MRSTGPERWPEFVRFIEGEQSGFSEIGNLEQQTQACLAWYNEKFPHIASDSHLDLTNINGIIPAIVFAGLDIRTLIAQDNTYERLVFNEARPDEKLWRFLETTLKNGLSKFHIQMIAYLQWAYGEKEEKQWDIGSRPPVGRYAPMPKRTPRSSPNQRDRSDAKSGSGGNFRRGPAGNRNDKRGDRGDRKGPPQNSPANREKVALIDVNNAVKKLKKDDSLAEVKLAPTNSFFRRLQHKHAISQGFESISVGEGQTRSVIVKRARDSE